MGGSGLSRGGSGGDARQFRQRGASAIATSLNLLFTMLNNGSMKPQNIESLWTHLHWLTVLAQQGSFTARARGWA
jgi:hypothetical protein